MNRRGTVSGVPIDEGVRNRVRALVAEYLDADSPAVDLVDGPVTLRSGTAMVYIRLIDGGPPVLRVYSPLLRHVERSGDLLAELNDLNARLSFLRLFWRDGTVFAATELLATALTTESLRHACDTVADTADYYDERLEPRYGGEKAYEDRASAAMRVQGVASASVGDSHDARIAG